MTPGGVKSWVFRYRINGKRDKLVIGRYPDVTLKAARDERAELAAQVARGESPADGKEAGARRGVHESHRERVWGAVLHGTSADPWKDPKSHSALSRQRDFPALGEKTLKDVNALDVQGLVYRKRDNGQVAAAIQLRSVIKQIFDYAIETQLVTVNPAVMVATRYIGKARQRSRVLAPKEIRLYLRTIYQSNIRRQFKLALHIILLTLSRKSELQLARWEHLNFEAGEWLIPAENAKNGKPHLVYLSSQVAAMFRN